MNPKNNAKKNKDPSSENINNDDTAKKKTDKKKRSAKKNMNELERLYDYMAKYRIDTSKGEKIPHTNTIMSAPWGSYFIPDEKYNIFLKKYEDAVVAGYNPHITERHKEFGPIIIDFDFRHDPNGPKRHYTNAIITDTIKLYNRVIRRYLNVTTSCMDAYVTEKKTSSLRGNKYCDGIHIIYPHICTVPSLQQLMRVKFIELAEKYKLFDNMNLINSLDNVFDKGVIYQSNWLLYGSIKNPSCHVYNVTHIYSTTNGKIYDRLIPSENMRSRPYIKHFIDMLRCRRFYSSNQITPLAEGADPMVIDNEINSLTEKIKKTSTQDTKVTDIMGQNINFIKAVSEEILVEAKNLVKILSRKRASDYDTWIRVGKCLHNIDYRLLADWIAFSKTTSRDNFKVGECEILWKKFKPSSYTMASLHFFASQDNPAKYSEMKEAKINGLIKNGLDASHNSIAKLLMEKYKFAYKCASIKHDLWYEYKNHRWIKTDCAYTLRNRISDELTVIYSDKQASLYGSSKDKQGFEKEQCINEATYISKVIKQLNNNTFKNGVIKECAYISYDPNFLKNLDENIYLICFENGVYDLEADIFRDGCPDDYVSLCTNYKYHKYDENDEISKEIQDFFKKIQPDKEMREYLLTLMSTCLAGSISEENFYVFTGSGANGKSKLMELLKYTLGDLFKPMDIGVLTQKRTSSSAATPELADKKGIRACPFDEPRANDEINTGFMKIFTGGDTIMARALFCDPIYYKPQFKPFLLCNHLPNIHADDDGTWRRLKVIPFLSKFIKASDITKKQKKNGLEKGQYWADNNLSEKLPEWKEMFIGMLVEYYRQYRKNGLIHPKLVTQETAKYRKKCDMFQGFISDYLEKTDDIKNTVSVKDLYTGMRDWYKNNYDGKCPGAKDLRTYLQQRMPTFNTGSDALTCYKIKGHNQEVLGGLEALEM